MRKKMSSMLFAMVVCAVCITAAVAQTDPSNGILTDKEPGAEVLLVGATRTLATLRLEGGGTIQFIDMGDGHVGVSERAPKSRPFISIAMVRTWRATPLEIFLALAPAGSQTPNALTVDHNAYLTRTGGAPSPPRKLSGAQITYSLGDPGIEDFDCDSFGTNFTNAWLAAFAGVTDYAFAEGKHFLLSTFTFYPGGYYNDDGSISPGYNQVTYLGACNGDDTAPLTIEVHRRVKYVTPPTVTYDWVEIAEVSLSSYQKYTFYSNLPASYRGRAKAPGNGVPVHHYSLGVAYTKGFPVGIQF